jgi:hypothetical protein
MVGRRVTLDDLAMHAADDDEHHRYEPSPGGAVPVLPRGPGPRNAVSRLFAGADRRQLRHRRGGRMQDLTVWAEGVPPRQPRPSASGYAGTAGPLLALDVVSRGSEVVDRIVQRAEHAKAGIPACRFVERDGVTSVHRHVLGAAGEHEAVAVAGGAQPLAWLPSTTPDV